MNGKDKTAKRDYYVPNLDRALQILETLPSFPHGLNRNKIAAETGCSANMVYRMMMRLVDAGWGFIASSRRLISCRRRTSPEQPEWTGGKLANGEFLNLCAGLT